MVLFLTFPSTDLYETANTGDVVYKLGLNAVRMEFSCDSRAEHLLCMLVRYLVSPIKGFQVAGVGKGLSLPDTAADRNRQCLKLNAATV